MAENGPAVRFFIAPDGLDTNPGTAQQPFATLTRTMAAVRQARSLMPGAPHPVSVTLRGGVYPLPQVLTFTPADSGTLDAPITYEAAPGERVEISGGKQLTGTWTRTEGKPFWQLDIPAARNRQWIFHSLFVNGESRMRARTPNHGEKELRALGPEPGGDPRQSLCYRPGDFNPAWTNLTDIDLVLPQMWTPTLHRIESVIPEKSTLRFLSAASRRIDAFERTPRYYLSNVFEALDEPGEWYLNRRTGVLYYYPMPGEDLTKVQVIAPVLKSRLIEFAGDLAGDHPIEYLHFRDLHFLHVDGNLERYNGQYRQGHMYLDAALSARGLRHASFEGCEFAQIGEFALELADGCREVTVSQCHFWDLGAGAMQLGVSDLVTLKTPLEPRGKPGPNVEPRREVSKLVIDNNCIHRLGTIWHGCYGIANRFASLTQITHNEIFDTHWDAIGLDARWEALEEKYSHGNEVAYNHLHHLGLRYESDAGAIYQFGPLDTYIHHNRIHDTFAAPYMAGFAGVYLDETSRGARVENNLVYNVDWVAFNQNFGDKNLIANNIAAFARDGLFRRGGLKPQHPNNFVEVTRNIYIAGDGLAIRQDWQAGPKPPLVHANRYESLNTPLKFAGGSFEQWQASGQDAASSVGEAGCRNPAMFDFRLKPDAPACKTIGFVPFDESIAQAGLYGEEVWRQLPTHYPLRKVSAVWSEEQLAPLNAFSIDSNAWKVGEPIPIFRLQPDDYVGFVITRDVAGLHGPQSIKCTDRKGLLKTYFPFMNLLPRFLRRGRITFHLAVMQPADAPAALTLELRGGEKRQCAGPQLMVTAQGKLRADSHLIGQLKAGTWTRLKLQFSLGKSGPQHYSLLVSDGQKEHRHELELADAAFCDLTSIVIKMPDDADGACYLDEVGLEIEDEP